MPRKHYTQKGLATTLREAQERHQRIQRERVEREEAADHAAHRGIVHDPLELAAKMTAAAHASEHAIETYADLGVAQLGAMLAGHGE